AIARIMPCNPSTTVLRGSVMLLMLCCTPATYAQAASQMPDWPVGGSVYTAPAAAVTAEPPTPTPPDESVNKSETTRPVEVSPTTSPAAHNGAVVHAAHRTAASAPSEHDHQRVFIPSDGSIESASQPIGSEGTQRLVPTIGLPPGTI